MKGRFDPKPAMAQLELGDILVIMGSVRAGRLCAEIADWICGVGSAETGLILEIVDLRDWHLPMDDEPDQPVHGRYVQAHTEAWSQKIEKARGFVFVLPQYNGGYPAAVKNALDHLYNEWGNKPALIVSYGGSGGVQCADQIRSVLLRFKMDLVDQMPALRLPRSAIDTQSINPVEHLGAHQAEVAAAFLDLSIKMAKASASESTAK